MANNITLKIKERYYTVGEIVRGGLLLNHKGEPFRHKATVLRIAKTLPHKRTMTPWAFPCDILARYRCPDIRTAKFSRARIAGANTSGGVRSKAP